MSIRAPDAPDRCQDGKEGEKKLPRPALCRETPAIRLPRHVQCNERADPQLGIIFELHSTRLPLAFASHTCSGVFCCAEAPVPSAGTFPISKASIARVCFESSVFTSSWKKHIITRQDGSGSLMHIRQKLIGMKRIQHSKDRQPHRKVSAPCFFLSRSFHRNARIETSGKAIA